MADPIIISPKKSIPVEDAEPDTFPESGGPCKDCAHGIFPDGSDKWGQCRSNEPKLQLFLLPPKAIGLTPVPYPIATWPQVSRRQGCGIFRARKSKQQ